MKRMELLKHSQQILIIIILAGIVYSFAMFQGGFVSWFLFYSLIPFLVYSLLLGLIPINIQNVKRIITPSRFVRGKNGTVTVQFEIKSPFPFIFLTVQEIGKNNQKEAAKEKAIFFVGLKKQFQWTYELQNLQRGLYHFEAVSFEFHDFFGWMTRKKTIYCPQSIIVYPNIVPIQYQPIHFNNEQGGIINQFSLTKDTTMVTGVRNYQSGDQFSRIHWKSFAKDETLRTKEFEHHKTQKLFLVLDRSVEQHFDDAVDLTASILQAVVRRHEDISFLSIGKERFYEPNVKTALQMEKVLEHLAVVKPDGQFSIDTLFLKEDSFLKGSLVVVVTGFLSEQVKSFFTKQNLAAVLCFVVGVREDYETMKDSVQRSNVKIVPLTKEMFRHAFTEVMKP